ncbi:nitroreductase [Sphingobium tyrosinilyticum]|uniref:Nitroreductase n=2 Tax=Sphingobium tyrosinilyticum TaxID=2715436 RepID=A0ABV9F2P2_9SPHN
MAMEVSEAVATRRSVRAFLPTPVEEALLLRVLEKARRAPSGGNVQPWHGVVVSGAALERLIAAVGEQAAAGTSTPDYDIYPPALPEPYRSRRFQCGEEMYAAIGIPREDRPARLAHVARNLTAFGAPVVLFCHTPAFMGPPQWSDLGMWLQTIMLLLREEGVDSCPQEAWSVHGGAIRAHLDIPADHLLFCGLAIGYADNDAPINQARIDRAPLAELIRFKK